MDRIITHGCGHAESHIVGGYWVADRDREADRLARRKCTACAAEAKRVAAGKAQLAARDQLGPVELPPLSGSPRQVAWAETIRLQQLAALHRAMPDLATQAARLEDARWWIEHRSDTVTQIAALVSGEAPAPPDRRHL
ncbi:hypothetical protein [Sphingomonas bacterium]|uniref:hypothetical protein n=1 Tax=Sphingomonas bacterium TaxID=1895847 RepID=UPI0015757B0D|nr:hypothetical protein [Sphingomonas bacterium]